MLKEKNAFIIIIGLIVLILPIEFLLPRIARTMVQHIIFTIVSIIIKLLRIYSLYM